MRISSNRSSITSKIKIFCFDFLFNFQNNSLQNPSLLLFLDLLDLLTLPCLYINPIYTHLTNQPVFNILFSQVYPNFYHFYQNPQNEKFPIALLIFCICIVVLTFFKNSKPNLITMVVQIILATLPIFIFRIASQFANLFRSDLNYQIVGFLFFVVTLIAMGLVLIQYDKRGKFADFVVGFMLFMNINQYALMGVLCVKIILILTICKMYHTKFIKIGVQASLLISLFCLKFVKPVTINYIMFLILIGLGVGYPSFNMFINLKYKDLSRIKPDEDDQYCTQSSYSMSEVEYFKHLNKHINSCLELGCKCKEILYIKGLKDLKRWVPAFNKSLIKRKIQNIKEIKSKISQKPSDYFDAEIEYVKNCFESEQIDFEGFIILNKLRPQNIFQQYKKYENQKKYKQLLQKLNPKFLKMTLIKQSQNGNTFDQILRLQNKICELIEKIKEFWTHLLNYQHNNVFAELIYQISDDIIDINHVYENVEERYDEKEEAQFYFQIFRLLAIHQKPENSLLSTHLSNYLMVTKGDFIINVTTNLTHLMQKSKNALINNKYTKLMYPVHTNGHSLWVKQFLSKYNPTQQNNFIKVISIGAGVIKVVKMMHLIIPSFSTSTQSQFNEDNSQSINQIHEGVFVVTCIKNKSKQEEEQGRKQKTIFHLLVCRQTLDIIGYQSTIFDYFNAKNSIDNSNKILRSNLKILFPNLNRQAILKKNPAAIRRLIAKQNKQFFQKEQYDMKVTMTQPTEELMLKKIPERVLYISQVPNKKNEQLNLLLLSFELSIKKQQKQAYKKSIKKIEQEKWKQKTIKNLKETRKKKKLDQKQSQSHKTLNIIKIVLIASFLFSFGLIIAIFTEFELISNQLQPFNDVYDSKSIVRSYQSYTEAYLLGFPFGQNKQNEIQQYWQFNEEYTDIATVFKYIKQLPFISKFNSYIKQFQQRQSYEDLSDLVSAFVIKIQKLKVAISIIFYTGILMLIINLIFNFAILIKIEEKAIKIVQRFLKIDCQMIKTNIWKIKQLQKWLEVSNYQQEQIILVSQNSNPDQKGELKKQSIKKQPTYTGVNILKRSNKKTKTRLRRTSIQFESENQVYFEIVLNQFLKQGPQINALNQQNEQKQSSIIQLSTKNLQITEQQIPKQKIKKNKVTFEQNISKQQKKTQIVKQKQLSEEQEQSQNKISLWQSVYKNSLTLIPSIVCFILKLSLLLLLLLLVSNFLICVQRSISFKHRLYYQPVVIMSTMQSEYWSPSASNEIVLIKYYEQNNKLLEQLPPQFAEFVQFQQSLSLAERTKLLCDFMQRTPNNKQQQKLYNQCRNNSELFQTGIEVLIENIQTKIRKINTGQLDRAQLLKQNQLTLAIKVCLSVYRNRNNVFTDVYLRYLNKYMVIRTAIRYSIISIFLLCLILQIREFNYTEKRINRTQNLFKIVPPFMKNAIKSLQIQNI